ncbi:MAG: hypothetical protein HRU20_20695 [Pseudomonadales bacterium]|nr:hypothetical protein [Pseudomonadales bacterium]
MVFYTIALHKLNSFTREMGIKMAWLMFAGFVFVVGYAWSFLETFGMAKPIMASFFYDEKMDLMFKYG